MQVKAGRAVPRIHLICRPPVVARVPSTSAVDYNLCCCLQAFPSQCLHWPWRRHWAYICFSWCRHGSASTARSAAHAALPGPAHAKAAGRALPQAGAAALPAIPRPKFAVAALRMEVGSCVRVPNPFAGQGCDSGTAAGNTPPQACPLANTDAPDKRGAGLDPGRNVCGWRAPKLRCHSIGRHRPRHPREQLHGGQQVTTETLMPSPQVSAAALHASHR